MNCKEVRRFILTDHIDGELDKGQKKELLEHLSNCPECSAYLENVVDGTIRPFSALEQMQPSDELWGKIKSAILEEKTQPGPFTAFMSMVHSLVYIRTWRNRMRQYPLFVGRPAMAITGALAMILVAVVILTSKHNIEYARYAAIDRAQYIMSLTEVQDNGNSLSFGFGTVIEEYFL